MLLLENTGTVSTDKLSYVIGDTIIINWSNVSFMDGAIKLYNNSGYIKQKLCVESDSGHITYNIMTDDEIGNWWVDLVSNDDTIISNVLFNVTHICPIPIADIIFI